MLTVRTDDRALIFALIAANHKAMTDALASFAHKAKSASTTGDFSAPVVTVLTVSAANATDLNTSIALVNNVKAVVNQHFTDVVPHNTSVTTVVATANGTDLASSITLANGLKTSINASFTATAQHYTADSTNTITNANATDQTTLNTLVNEMKTKVSAHIISAPGGYYINNTAD